MYYALIEIIRSYSKLPSKEKRLLNLIGSAVALVLLYFIWSLVAWLIQPTDYLVGLNGRVLFQGEPVVVGTIEFVPTSPDIGRARHALIKDGVFQIEQVAGLIQDASYDLLVKAFRGTGEFYENNPDAPQVEVQEQYLPEIYNNKTELAFTADDESLSGDLILDLK